MHCCAMVAAALAIRQLQAAQRSEVEAFPDLVKLR
jgi:hypothetical protein